MNKCFFIFLLLLTGLSDLAAKKPKSNSNVLGEVLSPAQKQEYDMVKAQFCNYRNSLVSEPCPKREIAYNYLEKIGTPIALRLLENVKK